MRGASRRALLATLCVTLAVAAGSGAAAAEVPDRAFVVALQDDGSAAVGVTYTYDLADESDRQALQDLREDGDARDALAERFATRLRSVAEATEDRTGRQMSIETPRVDVVSEGDTAAVTVTVTWNGLAGADGNELTVSEPFASEFAPDRPLRVVAPDGYAIDDASPDPDSDDGDAVEWVAGSDLSAFSVTASPDGSTDLMGPGFGVLAAVGGVAALIALARHRTR